MIVARTVNVIRRRFADKKPSNVPHAEKTAIKISGMPNNQEGTW